MSIVDYGTAVLDFGGGAEFFTCSGKRARDLIKSGDTFSRTLTIENDYRSKLSTPPDCPDIGDSYLVVAPATGAWVGQEGMIARWNGAAWDFLPRLVDLTGWTGASEIRDDSGALVETFTVTPSPLDATGQITLSLTPAQTEPLEGRFVYDLEITSTGGDVKTLVCGSITFTRDVTA